jgi:hypothetical protein
MLKEPCPSRSARYRRRLKASLETGVRRWINAPVLCNLGPPETASFSVDRAIEAMQKASVGECILPLRQVYPQQQKR